MNKSSHSTLRATSRSDKRNRSTNNVNHLFVNNTSDSAIEGDQSSPDARRNYHRTNSRGASFHSSGSLPPIAHRKGSITGAFMGGSSRPIKSKRSDVGRSSESLEDICIGTGEGPGELVATTGSIIISPVFSPVVSPMAHQSQNRFGFGDDDGDEKAASFALFSPQHQYEYPHQHPYQDRLQSYNRKTNHSDNSSSHVIVTPPSNTNICKQMSQSEPYYMDVVTSSNQQISPEFSRSQSINDGNCSSTSSRRRTAMVQLRDEASFCQSQQLQQSHQKQQLLNTLNTKLSPVPYGFTPNDNDEYDHENEYEREPRQPNRRSKPRYRNSSIKSRTNKVKYSPMVSSDGKEKQMRKDPRMYNNSITHSTPNLNGHLNAQLNGGSNFDLSNVSSSDSNSGREASTAFIDGSTSHLHALHTKNHAKSKNRASTGIGNGNAEDASPLPNRSLFSNIDHSSIPMLSHHHTFSIFGPFGTFGIMDMSKKRKHNYFNSSLPFWNGFRNRVSRPLDRSILMLFFLVGFVTFTTMMSSFTPSPTMITNSHDTSATLKNHYLDRTVVMKTVAPSESQSRRIKEETSAIPPRIFVLNQNFYNSGIPSEHQKPSSPAHSSSQNNIESSVYEEDNTRVFSLELNNQNDHPIHVKLKLNRVIEDYKTEFSDNTQLYGLLNSADPALQKMEIREPYEQGECVPMAEWQTTFHPSCNGIHEYDLLDANEKATLFGTKGYWRNAWHLEQNHFQQEQHFVLKTLKYEHNFEDAHFEHDRVDAVAMERLTASPHVIDIYGFCGHAVITEYADQPRLGTLADKNRKNATKILEIARDIANGLADVHDMGKTKSDIDSPSAFVHLDINPANVVSVGGTLKLNDFNIGIMRKLNTTSNEPCGFPAQYPNPQWRSPEEAWESQNLGEKVDVFSMGHIFFRLICGHEPWNKLEINGKPSKEEINRKVKKHVLPHIPDEVKTSENPATKTIYKAMMKCYRYKPENRPSAREIANYIDKALQELLVDQSAEAAAKENTKKKKMIEAR